MESISNVASIGGGGNSDNETIELEDFEALSQEEKDNGTAYYIPDANILTSFSVVGNRFDKANIYTTTEKMIGSYMGKPLYQKTFTDIIAPDTTDGTETSMDIDVSSLNIESVQYIQGIMWNLPAGNKNHCLSLPAILASNKEMCNVIIATTSNVPKLRVINTASAFNGRSINVTIKYTKTSDGTVRVGTGNDYSTDEQIIGTWIDGKPLYQKTVQVNISVTTDLISYTSYTSVNNLNIKDIIDMKGILFQGTSSNSNQISIWFSSWINADEKIKYIVQGWYNKTNARLCIDCNRASYSGKIAYITIQYTKTTD